MVFIFKPVQEVNKSADLAGNQQSNALDGCEFVYLDMGTNTGVQIRKLYEPDKFLGAAVLPIFERYFGPAAGRNLSAVCAVGWEPNPGHTAYLARLQAAYRRCGWRVEIHTETGVGARQEVAEFAVWPQHGASRFLAESWTGLLEDGDRQHPATSIDDKHTWPARNILESAQTI